MKLVTRKAVNLQVVGMGGSNPPLSAENKTLEKVFDYHGFFIGTNVRKKTSFYSIIT